MLRSTAASPWDTNKDPGEGSCSTPLPRRRRCSQPDVEGGEGQEGDDGEAGPTICSLLASLPCHPLSASPSTQDMLHCKCLCQSGHSLNTWFSMCSPMETLIHTCLDSSEQQLVNTHVQSQKYLLIVWVFLPLPEISYILGRLSVSQLLPLCSNWNFTKPILFAQPLFTKAMKTFVLLKTLGSWQRLFGLKLEKYLSFKFILFPSVKITTLKLANSQPTHKVVLVNKDPAARWAEIQIINRKALKYITDLQTENTYFFFLSLISSSIHFRAWVYSFLTGWRDATITDEYKVMKMTQTRKEKSHQTKRKP